LVSEGIQCGHNAVGEESLWGCSWVALEEACKAHHCYSALRHSLVYHEPRYASALYRCQTPCTFYHQRGGYLSECLLRGVSVLALACKMNVDPHIRSELVADNPWRGAPYIHVLYVEVCNPYLVADSLHKDAVPLFSVEGTHIVVVHMNEVLRDDPGELLLVEDNFYQEVCRMILAHDECADQLEGEDRI